MSKMFLFLVIAVAITATQTTATATATPSCDIPNSPYLVTLNDTSLAVTQTIGTDQLLLLHFDTAAALEARRVNWIWTTSDGNQQVGYKTISAVNLSVTSLEFEASSSSCVVTTATISNDAPAETVAASITLSAGANATLRYSAKCTMNCGSYNTLSLKLSGIDTTAALYGGGEQYNTLDLRGQVIPIFTREQGVGRGQQPLTWLGNTFDHFAGGSVVTNYAARPILVSHRGWLFTMTNPAFSELDLSRPGRVTILVNDTTRSIQGNVGVFPNSLKTAVATLAALLFHKDNLGRPRAPPEWSYRGAIIGMQGGTKAVLTNLTALLSLDTPMSAFWLQDWTGPRQLTGRVGVLWSWGQWNEDHYPNHTAMIQRLHNTGIRTLIYLNPMLVDSTGIKGIKENPWKTAMENCYFVRRNSQVFRLYNNASMIDFRNAAAWEFFCGKDGVIVKSILSASNNNSSSSSNGLHTSGAMVDFGEAFPLDADNISGGNSTTDDNDYNEPKYQHNLYPDEWFRCVKQAEQEAGITGDAFWFGRSSWLSSSALYSSAWSGDQLCDFSPYDGIGSAATSLISSGLTATPFQHSDIGGYNAIDLLGGVVKIQRTQELFFRWCELSAFSTFFRTHDGSDPHKNWQFYSDEYTRKQFSRYAKLFAAWFELRRRLVNEAVATGVPVVRSILMEYPHEAEATGGCPFPVKLDPFNLAPLDSICNNYRSFLLGTTLFVAPVLTKGAETVTCRFPGASSSSLPPLWIHVFTGASYPSGTTATVSAKIGCPAVFVNRASSLYGALMSNFSKLKGSC